MGFFIGFWVETKPSFGSSFFYHSKTLNFVNSYMILVKKLNQKIPVFGKRFNFRCEITIFSFQNKNKM